jgi:hypothetical protein
MRTFRERLVRPLGSLKLDFHFGAARPWSINMP